MPKALILLVFVCLFSGVSIACDVEKISSLITNERINAKFEQIKEIEVLSKPLRSYGFMWMSETNNLVWQVNKPIKSTMVINAQGMSQYDRYDKKLAKQKMMSMEGVSSIFLNLAKGDLKELEKEFDMNWDCQSEEWQVTLKPKENKIADFLSTLSISGSNRIEKLSYTEVRGDITHITLTQQSDKLKASLNHYLE